MRRRITISLLTFRPGPITYGCGYVDELNGRNYVKIPVLQRKQGCCIWGREVYLQRDACRGEAEGGAETEIERIGKTSIHHRLAPRPLDFPSLYRPSCLTMRPTTRPLNRSDPFISQDQPLTQSTGKCWRVRHFPNAMLRSP